MEQRCSELFWMNTDTWPSQFGSALVTTTTKMASGVQLLQTVIINLTFTATKILLSAYAYCRHNKHKLQQYLVNSVDTAVTLSVKC